MQGQARQGNTSDRQAKLGSLAGDGIRQAEYFNYSRLLLLVKQPFALTYDSNIKQGHLLLSLHKSTSAIHAQPGYTFTKTTLELSGHFASMKNVNILTKYSMKAIKMMKSQI